MAEHSLCDVFKLSGVPDITFVEPVEFPRLVVALDAPGRGVVIEGPSGIGKTSAVTKALEKVTRVPVADVLTLSGRKRDDRELIAALPGMKAAGIVVIDDFHRLDADVRSAIADHLKILADEEAMDTKIIIIGINQAGSSLLSFAPDLIGRIEIIKFGVNPDDRVERVIALGSEALNIAVPIEPEVVAAAKGSFNIAQMLCHDACLAAGVTVTEPAQRTLDVSFELVRERVLDRLADAYYKRAEVFAKGKKLRREGRAPYLQILRWLALSDEWTVDLDREMSKNPTLRGSVGQVVDKGHLANLLNEQSEALGDLLHYDAESHVLAVEDPKFYFFIRNLAWNRFAERLGYFDVSFSSRYDYALSFSGSDRDVAEMLFEELSAREHGVFYDANEQDRILAENVEEYLAPIYKSEATYVVVLLGKDYPRRIWTRFESEQFKHRFGEKAVIPVWFTDVDYSSFDVSREVGGETLDRTQPLQPQVEVVAKCLSRKLAEHRMASTTVDPKGELEEALD